MWYGVVIDAHTMRAIRNAIVTENGVLYDLICWIINNCGLATTKYIEAHWETKCGQDPVFWKWYKDQVLNKAARDIPIKKLDSNIAKKIRERYCLPKDPFVLQYIKCANSTSGPRYILADDIYLHDPKAGRLPSRTQNEIRERRRGNLCRYLEKYLDIRVGTTADCISYFSIALGPCSSNIGINPKKCPKIPNN